MPIGENAIKRAANNGYSKVKTTAPDMENSVIAEPETIKKAPVKSAKTTTKRAVKNSVIAAPAIDAKKIAGNFVTYKIGDDLPEYLL